MFMKSSIVLQQKIIHTAVNADCRELVSVNAFSNSPQVILTSGGILTVDRAHFCRQVIPEWFMSRRDST